MKKKSLRIILSLAICVMVMTMFSVTAFAAGDVSGAIESTWNAAKSQVQTVVNNVVSVGQCHYLKEVLLHGVGHDPRARSHMKDNTIAAFVHLSPTFTMTVSAENGKRLELRFGVMLVY